jgi:hypothetical protein
MDALFSGVVEQDERGQHGAEVILYVADDGTKIGDGKNPTDVHCDPPQKPVKRKAATRKRSRMSKQNPVENPVENFVENPGENSVENPVENPGENLDKKLVRKRIQVAFCAKTTTRRLMATPLTAKGFAILEHFLAGRGGFTSLEKYPQLCAMLKKFAVGPEPGERAALCWDSHAPHFEQGPRGPSTIRAYAGLQFLEPSQVSPEEMVRLAFLRLHHYTFAPFERKANGANELFVNAKSTQSHLEGLPPDPKLHELLLTPVADQKTFLKEFSDFTLKLLGVRRCYL